MFPTRVPVSEFTSQAFEGHIKELESLTFFSKTDLYAIAAGERPDHLLYARELHRGLCQCNPEAAKSYRGLLDSDAELIAPKVRAEAPDDFELKRLCDGLTTALLSKDAGAVQSAMWRLYPVLGERLKKATYYPPSFDLGNAG